jgi:isocitrate dehydrogenase
MEKFAISCFEYALEYKISLYFSTRSGVYVEYDEFFVNIFNNLYTRKYKALFAKKNIIFEHKNI